MKKFLEMIEIVKGQGQLPVLLGKDPLKPMEKALGAEMFFHFAEHSVPFVFVSKNKSPEQLDAKSAQQEICGLSIFETEQKIENDSVELAKVKEIDAPFKIFTIEMLGEKNYITIPEDKFGPIGVWIEAIMVVEQKPKEYIYIGLFTTVDNHEVYRKHVCVTPDLDLIVKTMLERLRIESAGVEHIRERVKIGSGKEKRVATFRRIVHIRPKKLQTPRSEVTGREIEWSHRWEVRGHWRKVAGIGKDREGNYCIESFTWVKEHEKGAEDAVVIKKTRLVVNE